MESNKQVELEQKIKEQSERYEASAASAQSFSVDKGALVEMKSFASPPDKVKRVMEMVLMIMGSSKKDWATAKHLMKDPSQFQNTLVGYDFTKVQEKTVTKICQYLNNNQDMTVEDVKKVSTAAVAILKWCLDWLEASQASIESQKLTVELD